MATKTAFPAAGFFFDVLDEFIGAEFVFLLAFMAFMALFGPAAKKAEV